MGGLSTPNAGPRRLSKPRMNGSSSALLKSPDPQTKLLSSPAPVNQQDYFGDHDAIVSSQGERRSRRKSRSRIRAYLHGSNGGNPEISSDEDGSQSPIVGVARDVRKRLSRTGSSVMQMQSAKASTACLSSASSSRLHQSGSSEAEETIMVADQIKERAMHDRLAAQNHVTSPVDEDKHVDSVMAPLRRKSLYTPGLATRNASDILKKPPQPEDLQSQPDRDYYYDPSRPKDSPLSQLAALRFAEDGRSTPSDIHYPQLGGLQLGTLRVTNGNTSPVPWTQTPDSRYQFMTLGAETSDDYYTSSEGNMTGCGSITMNSLHGRRSLSSEGENPRSTSIGSQDNTTPRSSLPPQKEDQSVTMAHEYISELSGSPFSSSDIPTSKTTGAISSLIENSGVDYQNGDDAAAGRYRQSTNNNEIRCIGNEPQKDALRKLVGSHQASTIYFATSRCSISNDIPEIDDGYASKASLHTKSTNSADMYEGSQIFATRGAERTSTENPNISCNYISCNKSLIDVTHAACAAEVNMGLTGLDSPEITRQRKCCSSVMPEGMPDVVFGQSGYPLQPPGRAPFPCPPSVGSGRGISCVSIEPTPSAQSATSSSPHRLIRKLQKPRPKSQPPPAVISVRGHRDLTQAHIPRVPSMIAARHADRLREFPLLEHTYPSSQHINLEEDYIPVSVVTYPIRFPSPANALETSPDEFGNEGTHSNIVRSPSWSNFGDSKKRRERKRFTKRETESDKRSVQDTKELESQTRMNRGSRRSIRSRSASRTRGRSSDRTSQHDAVATIADFGTVTRSLGANPYDIATALLSNDSHNPQNWHPHQISTANPRPKSMFGSQETPNAEYSRSHRFERPKSYCGPVGPNESLEQTWSRQANNWTSIDGPQSIFTFAPPTPAVAAIDLKANNLDLAQVLSGQTIRSWSSRDTPPIPPLPSAQQVQQREAQIASSRPQSLIIDSPSVGAANAFNGEEPANLSLVKPDTPNKHRKPGKGKLVPDLWSHSSLEKKCAKSTCEPQKAASNEDSSSNKEPNDLWATQRQAWSQRRKSAHNLSSSTAKSAGELLLKDQITNDSSNRRGSSSFLPGEHTKNTSRAVTAGFSEMPALEHVHISTESMSMPQETLASNSQQEHFKKQSSAIRNSIKRALYHVPITQQYPRPGPSPLVPPRQTVADLHDRPPLPNPPTSTSTFEHISGRYEGGLLYGYEPGCGVGGSAGTRSSKTEASRKSVDVSRGWGLDLSDVPIFVQAEKDSKM